MYIFVHAFYMQLYSSIVASNSLMNNDKSYEASMNLILYSEKVLFLQIWTHIHASMPPPPQHTHTHTQLYIHRCMHSYTTTFILQDINDNLVSSTDKNLRPAHK